MREGTRKLNGKPSARHGAGVVCLALALALAALMGGCSAQQAVRYATVEPYQPKNIYLATPRLPSQIRRVAVMPISVETEDWVAERGRVELSPVLRAELGKAKAFETIYIEPAQLREWTMRPQWLHSEPLPASLFERITRELGCDAVLFTHLRPYRPYSSIVMGWHLKLVELKGNSIVWAADEVFDAGEPSVAKAAQAHYRGHQANAQMRDEAGSVLNSPRRFAQYSLAALFATLPPR